MSTVHWRLLCHTHGRHLAVTHWQMWRQHGMLGPSWSYLVFHYLRDSGTNRLHEDCLWVCGPSVIIISSSDKTGEHGVLEWWQWWDRINQSTHCQTYVQSLPLTSHWHHRLGYTCTLSACLKHHLKIGYTNFYQKRKFVFKNTNHFVFLADS